jgi:lipoprotein-releasing system ATP-binding protein
MASTCRWREANLWRLSGSSGSGKTTLLHLLGGLDTPTSGEVRICGEDFSLCNEVKRGLATQPAHRICVPVSPSAAGVHGAGKCLHATAMLRDGSIAEAEKAATAVVAASRAWVNACSISRRSCPGGSVSAWRWRVHWSRGRPWCWPTSPRAILDNETSQDVQALLQELNRELGISFVIVTHDTESGGDGQTGSCAWTAGGCPALDTRSALRRSVVFAGVFSTR